MRQRIERKIRKRLRLFPRGKQQRDVAQLVRRYEQDGMPQDGALRKIMVDTGASTGWMTRGNAAKLLAIADPKRVRVELLDVFFAPGEKTELWETALAIEWLGDMPRHEPSDGSPKRAASRSPRSSQLQLKKCSPKLCGNKRPNLSRICIQAGRSRH